MARHLTTKARRFVAMTTVCALAAAGAVATIAYRAAPPTMPPLTFGCEPGVDDVYTLAYQSEGALTDPSFGLGGGVMPPEAMTVKATATSRVHRTCVVSDTTEHTIAVTFEAPTGRLEISRGEGSGSASELLLGTTYVTRDARGFTKSVRYPPEMPEGGRSMVRDILALTQVTAPSLGAAAPVRGTGSWQSREEDANGPFDALYRITANDGEVLSLSKERLKVAPKLREDATRPHAEVRGGRATFRVSPEHALLESAEVVQELTLVVGARSVGTSSSRVAFTRERSDHLPEEAQRALLASMHGVVDVGVAGARVASDLAGRDSDARVEARMQRAELGADTWRSLSAQLDDASVDRTKTFLKLKALFLLEPARCQAAGSALTAMTDPGSRGFTLLAGALAAAGTPAAQRALIGAARATSDKPDVQRALVATTGLVDAPPTGDVLDELASLSHDGSTAEARGSARLALGSLARADAASDGSHTGALVANELAELRAAQTPDDKVLSLLALGNAGATEALDAIRAALHDSDARVRVAAAAALRFVTAGDAEALLLACLTSDPSANVRAEAVRSLTLRNVTTALLDAFSRAATRDADDGVRLAAVDAMANDLSGDPTILDVLGKVAADDRAQPVRNEANLVLLRLRSRG